MRIVFVYGTLMANQRNHHVLLGSKFLGNGFVYGKLYQFPLRNYPIFRPNRSTPNMVIGELYEVSEQTLASLDRREVLYKRKAYRATVDGHIVDCDLYEGLKYLPFFLAKNISSKRWDGTAK